MGVGGGGRPIGTIPTWLASHPMFCSKSLECPGTQSSAPWGRHWCHRLDLIAGQVFSFIPALRLGRLPAHSLCQAQLGCVCLSCLWQLQACSWEQRASQGRLLQPGLHGPWTSLFKLHQPSPSCPSSQAPSNVTPHTLIPLTPPAPPFWGSEVFGKPCSQDLGTWRLGTGQCLPAALISAL